MRAIFETGGKQYTVGEGDVLYVERLPGDENAEVAFERVLAILDEGGITLGTPLLAGAKVNATILKHGKNKKIIVYKMKPKKTYRRKQGHRQPYTKIQIGAIEVGA